MARALPQVHFLARRLGPHIPPIGEAMHYAGETVRNVGVPAIRMGGSTGWSTGKAG
jgi:hypothetical protein